MRYRAHRLHRSPGLALTRVDYGPGIKAPLHEHSHFGITLVFAGRLEETSGRRRWQVGPGSIVVKPPGTPHANRYGPDGTRTLALTIDDAFFDESMPASALGSYRWLADPEACLSTLRLLAWTAARGGDDQAVIYDLLALLTTTGRTRVQPPGWLRHARERLDDEFPELPTVASLARGANVHPVSLTRAFRRHYGCSISAYRRHLRLSRAMEIMATSRHSLVRVAQEAGFADQPHLCRELARGGITPGGFRDWCLRSAGCRNKSGSL